MAHLNTTDLKQFLKKLRKNQTILQERKAKYAGSAPLGLLNQLDDYEKAIELTKDTLIGDLELEALKEALKPLILELDGSAEPAPLQIAPPPEPLPPPQIRGFVGRKKEIGYFMAKLKETNLALITGMVGCGKTALAATLAETWQAQQLEDFPRKIFWYPFYEDEGVLGIVHALAGFLYHDGSPNLWEMLESNRLANATPLPPANLFDYVFQSIRDKGYLLCLDDIQFVHDDKLLGLFVDRLRDLLDKDEVHLILTAWEKPAYITQPYKPIDGLNKTDTAHLLKSRGLNLSNDFSAEVHTLTEGNAKLLDLTVLVLRKAKNPARILKKLAQKDDIERYLLKQVDSTLSNRQRDTMIAVAVLLGYPANRSTLEEISGHNRLKQTILRLSDRYLLNVYDDEDEDEELYQSHTTLRNFYYDFPNRHELKRLHTLAAQIYEEEEDFMKAIRHYERAGYYEIAVELLITHFRFLINQGQIQGVQRLLNQLLKQNLTEIQIIKVNLALADIYSIAYEIIMAKEYYQQCYNLLVTWPPSKDKQIFVAKACRGIAEILLTNDVPNALQWIKKGLTSLGSIEQEEKINLLLLKSRSQILQLHYQVAQQTIEEALHQIPISQGWLHIKGLKLLGRICWFLGDIEKCIQIDSQALTLAEYHRDYFEMVGILNTIGVTDVDKGNLIAASSTYQEALNLAQDLGLIEQQLLLYVNLGDLHTILGNYQNAENYLLNLLNITKERNIKRHNIMAKLNLAQLYVRQAKFDKAKDYLKDTLTIASKVGLTDWIPDIHCTLASIALAKNKIITALQHANKAVQVASKFKMLVPEGIGWRILGKTQLANQNPTAAQKSFTKSIALLTNKDAWQLAQTQLEYGRYLIGTPQVEEGKRLLKTARDGFERMGCKVDLETVEGLLRTVDSL